MSHLRQTTLNFNTTLKTLQQKVKEYYFQQCKSNETAPLIGSEKLLLTPTVYPEKYFNAEIDALKFYNLINFGSHEENGILDILSTRSNKQRLAICAKYQELHSQDLKADIKSVTNGNIHEICDSLLTTLPELYSKNFYKMLHSEKIDETALIISLGYLSNKEIQYISKTYNILYGTSLAETVLQRMPNGLGHLIHGLIKADRIEAATNDEQEIYEDITNLNNTLHLEIEKITDRMNYILCKRNFRHIRKLMERYQQITCFSFKHLINVFFDGQYKSALLLYVHLIQNRVECISNVLQQILQNNSGCNLNKELLQFLIVTRCDLDMAVIKDEFEENSNETLADAIKALFLKSNYQKCLMKLIDER